MFGWYLGYVSYGKHFAMSYNWIWSIVNLSNYWSLGFDVFGNLLMILLMEKIPACRQAFGGKKKNAIAAFQNAAIDKFKKKTKGYSHI